MLCPIHGEEVPEEEITSYGYQIMCNDCFCEMCRNEATYQEHLEEFLQGKLAEFLPWAFAGSLIDDEYRMAGMLYAYHAWKKDHPDWAKEIEIDFSMSSPGEWEAYIKECGERNLHNGEHDYISPAQRGGSGMPGLSGKTERDIGSAV